jgi:hypothetical protein
MGVNLRICSLQVSRKLFINVGQDENYGPRYIYHHKGTHTHFHGNHIVLGFKYEVVLLMGTGIRMETVIQKQTAILRERGKG